MLRDDFDAVVVGAGLAGTAAAARAAELGARVMLLDQAEDPTAGGNTPLSGGSLHLAGIALTSPPDEIRTEIRQVVGNRTRRDLVEAVAQHAGRALAWALGEGVAIERPAPPDLWRSLLAPRRSFDHVDKWPGRGPQRALAALQGSLRGRGGLVESGVTARELLLAPDGHVTGVITSDGRSIRSRAVVLADGGFQANAELRRRHIGSAADQAFLRGASSGVGDGLRMGEAQGGQAVNLGHFYGHCLHRGALCNDRLWPMPMLDDLVVTGLVVNMHGERILDEGAGGIAAANALARQSDPRSAFVVVDQRAWSTAGRGSRVTGQPPPNPELERRGAVIYRGADSVELAVSAGIDPDGLIRTIREFNGAIRENRAQRLTIQRTGTVDALEGELLAMPLVPGITFTTGGLLINGRAQVLDHRESPIAGLYAAGSTAGGLQGGRPGDYVGGLAPALVFGLLAGESVAAGRTPAAPS